MANPQYKVGLVGATGLVGSEILEVLEERDFPVSELVLWASEASAGQEIECFGKKWKVEALKPGEFAKQSLDYIFFSGGGNVSETYCEEAAASGAIVIDNSSHFRLHKDVPLVVPEVNEESLQQNFEKGIIANPNCSTIQMMLPLQAMHEAAGLKRVVVSTYQSVSGAGADAMDEMRDQVGQLFSSQEVKKNKFPHQMAFNCLPHIDVFFENGMTKEEMKMILESRKILGLPQLAITATAVRVPVFIGHAESLNVELQQDMDLEELREVFSSFPGIELWDEPKENHYPTSIDCVGKDEVFVGRLRRDESAANAFHLWVVADNLRKGAATNAVQIAELCIKKKLHRRAA